MDAGYDAVPPPHWSAEEQLRNPPAIVRVISLEGTSFDPAFRKLIQTAQESAEEQELIEEVEALLDETQESPQPHILETESLETIPAGHEPPYYDGSFIGGDGTYYSSAESFFDIPPVVPSFFSNISLLQGEALYINGMSTPPGVAFSNMRQFAYVSGYTVRGIYNATDGNVNDVLQAVGDKFCVADNPAVDTTREALLECIRNNRPLHVLGDSHGALIFSRALNEVKSILKSEGMSNSNIEEKFHELFSVETIGGAAWGYPDGPRYVHYINDVDPVAFHFGLTPYVLDGEQRDELEKDLIAPDWMNKLVDVMQFIGVSELVDRHPGEGAKIIRFNDPDHDDWVSAHTLGTYLKQRQHFEDAYQAPEPVKASLPWTAYAGVGLRWLGIAAGLYFTKRLIGAAGRRVFRALGFGKKGKENQEQGASEELENSSEN